MSLEQGSDREGGKARRVLFPGKPFFFVVGEDAYSVNLGDFDEGDAGIVAGQTDAGEPNDLASRQLFAHREETVAGKAAAAAGTAPCARKAGSGQTAPDCAQPRRARDVGVAYALGKECRDLWSVTWFHQNHIPRGLGPSGPVMSRSRWHIQARGQSVTMFSGGQGCAIGLTRRGASSGSSTRGPKKAPSVHVHAR